MVEVKLHDIGEGMTEGEIIHYFKQAGDYVQTDEPLVEVQTDKMVAELPSPTSGTVKEIIIETGETVSVGTTLLYIEAEGASSADNAVEQPAPEKVNEQKESAPAPKVEEVSAVKSGQRVLATPYTRKIARDNGIDIEKVPATDPSGRVREEDVYRYIDKQNQPQQAETKEAVKEHTGKQERVESPESIPFRGMRRQIAKKMTTSLYTIPHVTHFEEVDMTNLLELRKELKETGASISVSAFFVKAIVIALKDFPIFNASLDEENEKIWLKKEYNMGLATDTDDGLIVPVVHHADQKSLQQLHQEIKELNEKARSGKLAANDLKNSTFTISNVGPLGSTGATPIINFPETGLIAFHKTKKQAVVNEHDEIVIRSMMNLSMSFDHRVADGATAVAFTNRFAELIENPNKLFLELV